MSSQAGSYGLVYMTYLNDPPLRQSVYSLSSNLEKGKGRLWQRLGCRFSKSFLYFIIYYERGSKVYNKNFYTRFIFPSAKIHSNQLVPMGNMYVIKPREKAHRRKCDFQRGLTYHDYVPWNDENVLRFWWHRLLGKRNKWLAHFGDILLKTNAWYKFLFVKMVRETDRK